LQEAAGIPASRVAAIVAGRSEFTDREIAAIERSTKLTGGQLAASAIEPKGGALTDLLNEWAGVASAIFLSLFILSCGVLLQKASGFVG
jgi:hypothetical protein